MSELNTEQIQDAIKLLEKNGVDIDNGKPLMMWVTTSQYHRLKSLDGCKDTIDETRSWLEDNAKNMGNDSFMIEY